MVGIVILKFFWVRWFIFIMVVYYLCRDIDLLMVCVNGIGVNICGGKLGLVSYY